MSKMIVSTLATSLSVSRDLPRDNRGVSLSYGFGSEVMTIFREIQIFLNEKPG